jgi:alkylation response protein AidB-like acyl-CoA dehydrogenase
MDFGLSEEQEMIVQTVRAFAETRDPVWKGK